MAGESLEWVEEQLLKMRILLYFIIIWSWYLDQTNLCLGLSRAAKKSKRKGNNFARVRP